MIRLPLTFYLLRMIRPESNWQSFIAPLPQNRGNNQRVAIEHNPTFSPAIIMTVWPEQMFGCRLTDGASRVAGVFYIIFETARLRGVDPEAYPCYATDMALRGDTPLLPHEWTAAPPAN